MAWGDRHGSQWVLVSPSVTLDVDAAPVPDKRHGQRAARAAGVPKVM
jgi:hypothetical protein